MQNRTVPFYCKENAFRLHRKGMGSNELAVRCRYRGKGGLCLDASVRSANKEHSHPDKRKQLGIPARRLFNPLRSLLLLSMMQGYTAVSSNNNGVPADLLLLPWNPCSCTAKEKRVISCVREGMGCRENEWRNERDEGNNFTKRKASDGTAFNKLK